MLKVFILKDRAGNLAKFEACGHANFNKRGKDIVCAGASALIQTCILSLKKQKIKAKIHLKKDCLSWTMQKNNSVKKIKEATLLINNMLTGLNEIQKKYPKNIKISIRRN